MLRFITRRPLWVNIVVAIGGVMILALVFLLSLNWITRHGESNTVPSLIGKNVNDAESLLSEKDFEIVIQDSVFYDSLPPGVVIRQVPEADDVVKVNRTVYVTINRFLPPEVEMPNLIGSSYRNAEMTLENLGLVIGDTSYRFDFAKHSVLEQLYQGKEVAPGTKLRMGSEVSLVLGSGLSVEDIAVPDLRGMTFDEARALLDGLGLSLGARIFDPAVSDSSNSFVYWQRPMPKTEDGADVRIRAGQMIDIRLGTERPVLDSLNRSEFNNQEP